MTIRVQSVTDRKVRGNVALRAYDIGDQDVVGGNPIPVYKVTDAELLENGGNFRVSGNEAAQFLVYEVTGETPLGGSAIPIYIVNDTATVPTAPTNLIATIISDTEIDLAWTDNSGDETGFNIYRDEVLIDTVPASQTSYNDSGLTQNTEYDYYVTAINLAGESNPSNTATETTLDTNYYTYESAMVVAPSTSWRTAANQLFLSIKSTLGVASINSALDFMYILAAETQQVALLNAVNPGTYNATNVNSMTFEANRGMTGNGSSSYLNSNFAPFTNGIAYQQNSASIGLYCRTNSNDADNVITDMGSQSVSSRSVSLRIRTVNFVIGSVNSASGGLFEANTNSTSLFIATRVGANTQRIYRAGNNIAIDNDASSSLPVNNIYIGAFNNNGSAAFYSNRQFAFAFAGRGISEGEQLNFYTAVQNFMTAIGAQV